MKRFAHPERNWEDLEIDLLLEGVYQRYGFDFRGYERASLKSKLHMLLQNQNLHSISALQDRVIHDPLMGETLLCQLNIRAGGLFDDPAHLKLLREAAVPWLRSHPAPKIWIAECVTAEEICTLSILLEEENVYEKTQIFATGSNEILLREASTGGIATARLHECAEKHRHSGGMQPLADYFQISSERAILKPHLRANITWAQFNLQTDASFNEFQLILCRRVLTDFGMPLQRKILHLFHDSLPMFGLLSIDDAKEIEPHPFSNWYNAISANGSLYKRVV